MLQRVIAILVCLVLASWIISNPDGAGNTVHHVLTSIGQFLSHSSGGTSSL